MLGEIRGCEGTCLDLVAAVVMPDHVHVIFRLLRSAKMSHVLQLMKGRSAKNINQLLTRRGALWMDESFDHVVRDEAELEEKIEYIKQNPIRKRLAQQPSDYKWLFVA